MKKKQKKIDKEIGDFPFLFSLTNSFVFYALNAFSFFYIFISSLLNIKRGSPFLLKVKQKKGREQFNILFRTFIK